MQNKDIGKTPTAVKLVPIFISVKKCRPICGPIKNRMGSTTSSVSDQTVVVPEFHEC